MLFVVLDASAPNLKLAAETFHVHSFVSFILLILKISIACFSTFCKFLNFMKKKQNLTYANLREVWPCHSVFKIREITGK